MPELSSLLAFAAIALGMVLTPGPNMFYLVSRSICQSRTAGLVSLGGIVLGFVFYMLCAAFGITALVLAVPYAYDTIRFSGVLYLLWLAWQAVRPGGRSPFQVEDLPRDSTKKLFFMGFLTSLLNPKIAVMYLSLLPQFINPHNGSVLGQAITLGATQIVISAFVNALIVTFAGSLSLLLSRRPSFAVLQRWIMGTILAGLAVRMATEVRR
ncbi:LysE family translocator [Sphingomonas xanthus]|uniref:LysE family translocator n=1 Tax=Sphingomonas xanthus TaxID=2594473 RepID=A0A516IP61_9SPHN|nr:LysE family translocator [Sphingomonas xanthus]QDP18708.1 LysE family translocator [Sphingomonas xanthus]